MQEALASGNPVDVHLERSCGALAVTRVADGRAETCDLDLGFELRFVVVLPLVARNRRLGALVLGYADREFDAATRALAEDLAARAAVAVDNCLLYAKVQEADQRKNEFLAMLAHELRNPLAPVRNAAQMLRNSQADAAKLEWAANVIDRQSQHLVRLVDDLLDVARITQGKITLSFEAVDVATVVAMAEEMTRQLIESRKHTLAVRMPPDAAVRLRRLRPHRADTRQSAQQRREVFRARQRYRAGSGGERRTRSSSACAIRASAYPGELLGSIFDLFIQADRSLDRSQGGLGIGLTIVRNLVHMQGGSVQARARARARAANSWCGCRAPDQRPVPQVAQVASPLPPLRTRRGCAFSSSTTIPTPRKAWRH